MVETTVESQSPPPPPPPPSEAQGGRGKLAKLWRSESSNHVRNVGRVVDEPSGRVKSAVLSNRGSSMGSNLSIDGYAVVPPTSQSVAAATATATAPPPLPPRAPPLSSLLQHLPGLRRRSAQGPTPQHQVQTVFSLLPIHVNTTVATGEGDQGCAPVVSGIEAPAMQPDSASGGGGGGREDGTNRLYGSSTGHRWQLQDNESIGSGRDPLFRWLRPSHDGVFTNQKLPPLLMPAELPTAPPRICLPPPPRPKERSVSEAHPGTPTWAAMGGAAEDGDCLPGHRPSLGLVRPVDVPQQGTNPTRGPGHGGKKGSLGTAEKGSGGVTHSAGLWPLRRAQGPDVGVATGGGGNLSDSAQQHHHQRRIFDTLTFSWIRLSRAPSSRAGSGTAIGVSIESISPHAGS